jgi:hypothetical protein
MQMSLAITLYCLRNVRRLNLLAAGQIRNRA